MKKIMIMAFVFTLMLCCGCTKSVGTQNQNLKEEDILKEDAAGEISGKDDFGEGDSQEKSLPEQTEDPSEEKSFSEKELGEQEPEQQSAAEPQEEFSFQDISDYVFSFSSGAGAWSTELRIHADGTFKGHYQDADMGDAGEGYAGGTLYVCDFTGKFGGLEKVDDVTWKMKLESRMAAQRESSRFMGFTMKRQRKAFTVMNIRRRAFRKKLPWKYPMQRILRRIGRQGRRTMPRSWK